MGRKLHRPRTQFLYARRQFGDIARWVAAENGAEQAHGEIMAAPHGKRKRPATSISFVVAERLHFPECGAVTRRTLERPTGSTVDPSITVGWDRIPLEQYGLAQSLALAATDEVKHGHNGGSKPNDGCLKFHVCSFLGAYAPQN